MRTTAVAAVCGLLLASSASGTSLRENPVLVKPPAGIPDLAKMALTSSDLGPQAKVRRQGYEGPPAGAVAWYLRQFQTRTVRVGDKRLVYVENIVSLAQDVPAARSDMASVPDSLTYLAEEDFLDKFQPGVRTTYVRTGKPVRLLAGDQAFVMTRKIGTRMGELRLLLIGVRVNRVLGITWVLGPPKVKLDRADAGLLARANAKRIAAGLKRG